MDRDFLPLSAPRDRIPLTTQFRSTWVLSSLRTIKERGHYDAYLAHLSTQHRAAVLDAIAGQWLPLDVAAAHYRACELLGLPPETQVQLGRDVSVKMQGTILGAAVRLAKNAGVTPWTAYAQLQRFWQRIATGGAIGVTSLGPKEARAEIVGCPLVAIPYFRNAVGGVLWGVTDLFCQRSFVREEARLRMATSSAYRVQWV